MKYFDYIVFDVDGTLADTEESVLSSLGQIIQEETGKTLPRHELEFALGIPGKNALEKLGIYSQATLDRWCQVAASFKSTISVFPGLHEVIATLSDNGCKLGIVSSRARNESGMGITPRHPKCHLQPRNPQRPANPNNQVTPAPHPFSPNTTRAIEQDGLGGSRTWFPKSFRSAKAPVVNASKKRDNGGLHARGRFGN